MPNALRILVYIKHTGRALSNEATIEYVNVWITGDVPKFVGADGATYGPYKSGDYVKLPKEDAERLISEGLASYTKPGPGLSEITETLSSISKSVETLSSSIESLNSSLADLNARVSAMETTMYAALAISYNRGDTCYRSDYEGRQEKMKGKRKTFSLTFSNLISLIPRNSFFYHVLI